MLGGLNLHVERGRVTAVVGPNGSGKTTLIKIILGLTRPDAGQVLLEGRPLDDAGTYRARVGYMPQVACFPENLSAHEVIALLKDLRGRPAHVDEELVEAFALAPEMDKPLRTLSGGNRQKVSAVLAFLFRPDVLILDEPTAGLDPVASSLLKDKILREKANGRTLILTSHIMTEVEELADNLVFLLEGHARFSGPVAGLKAATGQARLERAVAGLPTAKTGAAVRKQAPVVVRNLLQVMKSGEIDEPALYNGYSSCPVVTGYGKLMLAEFAYDNVPDPSFPFDMTKERRSMYLLKKYGLPFLYWNLMLKGLA